LLTFLISADIILHQSTEWTVGDSLGLQREETRYRAVTGK